jgi:HAMP domain-containing protein
MLVALRGITYQAFAQQQRESLSWKPYVQARQVRQSDLAHIARLMASDATLVTAWRTAHRELQDYSREVLQEPTHDEHLRTLRQACLPSLWDISQRLFLESDPSTADPSPHRQDYPACADLFLLCDDQGVVVVEETTVSDPAQANFGKVSIQFPLDPASDPPPLRLSLHQDPLFTTARHEEVAVSAYWFYGEELYHAVAVPSPIGAVILGDRVDRQMVEEASHLVGDADTLAWSSRRSLASVFRRKKVTDVEFQSAWTQPAWQPETRPMVLGERTYWAACYPLSSQVSRLDKQDVLGRPAGWMIFLKTTDELEAVAREQAWVTLTLVLAASLLGLAAAAPLAQRIAGPLLALSEAMAEVGNGNFEVEARPGGPTEIAAASQAFNRMVEGLRKKETLEKFVSKLEQLRKTADLHDPLVREQAQFGSYVVARRLGVGGMATVYMGLPLATLDEADRVAIKVIQRAYAQDADYQARFRREFEIMQRLQHPGLVRVYESGDLNGLLYIAMEYVEGENLRQLLEREGYLELPRFTQLATPLLEAVEAAHQAGVTHRDLKPENLMITQGGIKVMDFGLASASGFARLTQSGDTVGTPLYMAPEQVRGGVCEPSSDQYSVGVILFEMLTGITPFQGDHPMALILKHITDPPPRPRDLRSDIPERWEAVILKMLSKEPSDRYLDLVEVQQALFA